MNSLDTNLIKKFSVPSDPDILPFLSVARHKVGGLKLLLRAIKSSFVSTIPNPSQSEISYFLWVYDILCPYTKLPQREMQKKPSARRMIKEYEYPSRSRGIKGAESEGEHDKALKAFSTIFRLDDRKIQPGPDTKKLSCGRRDSFAAGWRSALYAVRLRDKAP